MLPNVGIGELTVIVLVALLVFGPKRLPEMMRTAGKMFRQFQTESSRAMQELRDATDVTGELGSMPNLGAFLEPDPAPRPDTTVPAAAVPAGAIPAAPAVASPVQAAPSRKTPARKAPRRKIPAGKASAQVSSKPAAGKPAAKRRAPAKPSASKTRPTVTEPFEDT